MKSISFIAFILSIFSNLHIAAQDQIFVEKFIYNNNSNSNSKVNIKLQEDLLSHFNGDKLMTEKAILKVENLAKQGIKVLTEDEYAEIINRLYDLRVALSDERDKKMIKKIESEIDILKHNYRSTKNIVNSIRRRN